MYLLAGRVVILQMSAQLTKKMSEDLLDLLTELTDLRNEDGGVVERVTTGVATGMQNRSTPYYYVCFVHCQRSYTIVIHD